MEFVRLLSNVNKNDATLAGGKGASLGEMLKADIPVPPGFVILSTAFDRFLDEAALSEELDAILDHQVNREEMQTIDLASERIQQLITSAAMPRDIAEEILARFRELGAEFVAVRSSATAEDSNTAAWAGQLDTFLNTTEASLLSNVQRCWASLFTPRAIFYRFEKGMHGKKISVAVVVQKMVESEISGIAFSVHPVTEDRNQMIIEAGFGLGEAIVSGQITPDSYIVEKIPRRIIDKHIAVQSRALHRAPAGSGNEWRELHEDEGAKPALSDEQTLELAELVLHIEEHYGFPCDIEWAYERGTFYITQSRPITTLAPAVSNVDADRTAYFTTQPIKIMGRYATYPADTELWHTEHTSRYFEETFGVWKEILAVHVFDKEFYMYICTPRSFQKKLHARIAEITAQDPQGMERIFRRFYDTKAAAKKELPLINPKDLTALSKEELVAAYLANRNTAHRVVVYDQFTWLAEEYWLKATEDVLTGKLGLQKSSAEYNDALFSLIKPRDISTTLEEKAAIIEKVLATRAGSMSPHDAAAALARDFGWMPVLAFGTPWNAAYYEKELKSYDDKDDAELENELRTIRNYTKLRDDDFARTVKKYVISAADAQLFVDFGLALDTRNEAEYTASLAGFYLLPLYEEMRKRLKLSIIELRSLYEDEIVACVRGEANARELLAQKRRFASWGIGKDKVRSNFTESESEKILQYLLSDENATEETKAGGAKGVIASRGKARGAVRLVPSPEQNDRVKKGDILFAYSTMVDNLPAMKRAAAIVTESGGLTCHAAVVSREFGIPCIVGLDGAMSMFKDGDVVEVDADKGTVHLIK